MVPWLHHIDMFERTILVTEGAGFIGGNFIDFFAQAHPTYRLIDLAHPVLFENQRRMSRVVPI